MLKKYLIILIPLFITKFIFTQEFIILHTNDHHGNVFNYSFGELTVPGLSERAYIINKILFEVDNFLKDVMDDNWNHLELKARGIQISRVLGKYLPEDYQAAIAILNQVVEINKNEMIALSFTDFIEIYGQDEKHWDISMKAMEKYTQYGSAEFTVRPFIINHEKRMMNQMYSWSKHENEHVRRLSSEGCRPQLPWAGSLPSFKKDPTPVLPILEELKDDYSLYVRRSVANNLNDISKTHPELVIKLAKKWYGENENINWVVKHGLRTLLKKANPEALAIFGYHNTSIESSDFTLEKESIKIGEDNSFSFSIFAKEKTKIRLEYGIDYVKANGKRSRKIFQISESLLEGNKKKTYHRKHSFADKSTRKHYPGLHSITLIINGIPQGTLNFELE